MNAHLTRFGRTAACATVLMLAPSVGHATMLAPGALVVPGILADAVAAGDVQASAVDLPFSTMFYSGTLTAAVVKNAGGTLDFYYQISNNGSSIHSLARNTDSLFALLAPPTVFTTDVFYRTDNAGLPAIFEAGDAGATPSAADRGLDGQVVGFDFLPGAAAINPGETSMILVIRTNATAFTDGFSSVLNALPASVVTFGPAAAPVPEPASLLLLSSAFTAAGYMARHRAKKRKRPSA
jgi:PEP-CTERM motif-containing protein